MLKFTHTTTDFNVQGCAFPYTPNQFDIDRLTTRRAIQIDHMQPARSRHLPALRYLHGIASIRGRLGVVSLKEPHTLPILNIDRWQYNHLPSTHFTKFLSNCRPAAPLFSG